MAAGSQALNGIWALLVILAVKNTMSEIKELFNPSLPLKLAELLVKLSSLKREIRIKASPTRFIIPVIKPAPKDLLLL